MRYGPPQKVVSVKGSCIVLENGKKWNVERYTLFLVVICLVLGLFGTYQSFDFLKFGRSFRTQGIQFSLCDSTSHQFKTSLFDHRMRSGMIHEKSVFCKLDGVFVLEGGKLDALLDGTVHALYQSITLRMVQCRSGVFDSTLGEIILYLVGGKLNTIVCHNMKRIALTHKYTLKKLYDTTSCNIGHKFNLAPFRKVESERDDTSKEHYQRVLLNTQVANTNHVL